MQSGELRERVFLRDYEAPGEPCNSTIETLKPLPNSGKDRNVNLIGGGFLPHRLCREIGSSRKKKNILVVRLESAHDLRHDPGMKGITYPMRSFSPGRGVLILRTRRPPEPEYPIVFRKRLPLPKSGKWAFWPRTMQAMPISSSKLFTWRSGRVASGALVAARLKLPVNGDSGRNIAGAEVPLIAR